MKTSNFFYVGASKFILARIDFSKPEEPRLVFFEERPSQGFYSGKVNDLESTSSQVLSLLEAARLDSFPEISVVLSHPEIKGYQFASSIFYSSSKRSLDQDDLGEVIRQTRNVSMVPLKETILQSIAQEYWVNDAHGIQNPIGMEAERLGVNLWMFTLPSAEHNHLVKIFDRSEAEIGTILPKAYSSSHSVLLQSEKNDGVLLLEMGGSSLSEGISLVFALSCVGK